MEKQKKNSNGGLRRRNPSPLKSPLEEEDFNVSYKKVTDLKGELQEIDKSNKMKAIAEMEDDLMKPSFVEKIQHFIGHISEAPHYIRDNEYIHSGYRINFSSPKKVLKRLKFFLTIFKLIRRLVCLWCTMNASTSGVIYSGPFSFWES